VRLGPSERVWALGSLCYAVSRVCETEMRRKLAILIKSKEAPESIQGKQRIQLGFGHHTIYYAKTGARDRGTRWRRQFTVPEGCDVAA
jgi:hypothetical protein